MKRIAFLAGASGLIGGHLLTLLLEDEEYDEVHLLLRKPLTIEQKKLRQHVVDFDHLKDLTDVPNANDVFCCLGTTMKRAGSKDAFEKIDHHYPVEYARLASQNNAERFFLVTSIGSSSTSSFFYLRMKAKTEQVIKSLPFRAVHIFRPSMLLGQRSEFRWEDVVIPPLMKMFSLALFGRWRKYRAIHARTVAHAMLLAAKSDASGIHVYDSDEIRKMGE